jgi:hypothetical protein
MKGYAFVTPYFPSDTGGTWQNPLPTLRADCEVQVLAIDESKIIFSPQHTAS